MKVEMSRIIKLSDYEIGFKIFLNTNRVLFWKYTWKRFVTRVQSNLVIVQTAYNYCLTDERFMYVKQRVTNTNYIIK